MGPKSAAGKDKAVDAEEEVLQAVILADSFNKRFKPLTANKPRCLLPVCNAPLLDWTFESLALAGVHEIFVVCRSYADQVKEAINNSKWSKPTSGLKITPIVTAKEAFSPGDAMRDIYTHGIITSDFVLVMGDLVSNIRIDEVVREHKERRRTNKDAIMTIVVKEAGADHRTRPRGETSVFVLDSQTSECLHYESVPGFPPQTQCRIPRDLLNEHPEVEVRNDLIDCSIDICSIDVPGLFQDNFDYLDIRRDFVRGVLTSDLLAKNIYCHVVQEGYAARVKDTKSYASVTKDILSRWTFPLVPDDNHPGGHTYEHLRGNRYIAQGGTVQLSRSCTIGPNSLIGSKTSVLHNAKIISSVIGERCTIGIGAVVKDSVLWDGVVLEDGVTVQNSILGEGALVKRGSVVQEGCLVGDGVVIGPGAMLSRFTRLSRSRAAVKAAEEDDDDEEEEDEGFSEGDEDDGEEAEDEDDEEDEEDEEVDSDWEEAEAHQTEAMKALLGLETNAIVWTDRPTEDDEELNEIDTYRNQRLLRLGDEASDLDISDAGSVTSASSSSEDEDSDDDFAMQVPGIGHLPSNASSATSLSLSSNVLAISRSISNAADSEFQSEVTQSLERAFTEGHSVDDAAVELKTLRMASNVPLRRVREAVVGAIVDRIPVVNKDSAGTPAAAAQQQRKEIAAVIDRWGGLIQKIGGADAVDTVAILQTHCAASPTRLGIFGQILAALYQNDVVEEDDIRQWHNSKASQGVDIPDPTMAEHMRKCWTIGTRMIEQFDEQDDESESGDEDAEDDEDDESEESDEESEDE